MKRLHMAIGNAFFTVADRLFQPRSMTSYEFWYQVVSRDVSPRGWCIFRPFFFWLARRRFQKTMEEIQRSQIETMRKGFEILERLESLIGQMREAVEKGD